MALNFSSIRQADFKSSQRLQDGIVQFQYVEDEKAGELKMPERIKLGIPVFRSGEAYKISARLKYTIKDQTLTIWYELERPDLVLDDAYSQAIKYIEEKTNIEIYRGMPS